MAPTAEDVVAPTADDDDVEDEA
jgi:hypothetical protein